MAATSIAENLAQVRATIAEACARVHRAPDSVTLVAVSKSKSAEMIIEAATVPHGVQHFGENRVEESSIKIPVVRQRLPNAPISWHMIGHVQSRKAKEVTPLFEVVHSIDSIKLAEKFSRLGVEYNKTLDVLLQMNVSGEASKEGFDAAAWSTEMLIRDEVRKAVRAIIGLPRLRVRGLMTIAPYVNDPEIVRPVFRDLRLLRDDLQQTLGVPLPELSMGMTDDYPVAIEEGATIVRIGRAIFGER